MPKKETPKKSRKPEIVEVQPEVDPVVADNAAPSHNSGNETMQMENDIKALLQEFEDFKGTKTYLQAMASERQKVVKKIENNIKPEKIEKTQPWYKYVFPEAEVKEEIASSGPKCDNPYLMQLAKLTLGMFFYLVYLDKNERLRCCESGDIEKMGHYDYEKDNEAIVRIRQAENFPTSIMPRKYRRMFLCKLGLAHEMRYNGCYEQVEPLVQDAHRFAAERNMAATRVWTLLVASLWAFIAVLLIVMIHYLVPSWGDSAFLNILKSQGMFAGLMGFLGGYTSLWLRYRSLGELTFGGRIAVAMITTCRLLIGSIFAYIAVLAMRSGFLFSAFDGHEAAIGIIGFVAGFSERFIPSFIQHLAKYEEENTKKHKDTNANKFKFPQPQSVN